MIPEREQNSKPGLATSWAGCYSPCPRVDASFRPNGSSRAIRLCLWWSLGSVFTTILGVRSLVGSSDEGSGFILGVTMWLWFTVLFANFAESIAEGHGKAQAASCVRLVRTLSLIERRPNGCHHDSVAGTELRWATSSSCGRVRSSRPMVKLLKGLLPSMKVRSPARGPGRPESGGDRSAVTGGTRVISDWLIVRLGHVAGSEALGPHDRHGGGCQAAEDTE